jgi:hypothetical protein
MYSIFELCLFLGNGVAPYVNQQPGSYGIAVMNQLIMIVLTPLMGGVAGAVFSFIIYVPFNYLFMPMQKELMLNGKTHRPVA